MNNKGFTLVELLVVIGILAIAATTIVVNIVGMQGTTENTEAKRFESKVTTAGCLYVDRGQVAADLGSSDKLSLYTSGGALITTRDDCRSKNGDCYVTLERLLVEGLLDENLIDYDAGKRKITTDTGELTNEEKSENIKVRIKWVDKSYNSKTYKEKVCEFCRNNVCR